MARSSQTAQKKGAGAKGSGSSAKAAGQNLRGNAARRQEQAPAPQPVGPNDTTRDILGVCLGVIAVASFIAVVSPSSAPVTAAISSFYHLGFGLGAYVLPFVVLGAAVCLFLRDRSPVSGRTAAGAALVFACVLALLALATPYTSLSTAAMFEEENLAAYGGYVGAGIASVLQGAFGKSIARVILVGAIVGGFVIIGFSIGDFVAQVGERLQAVRAKHQVPVNERPWGGRAEEADQAVAGGAAAGGAHRRTPAVDDSAKTTYLGDRETTVAERADAPDGDENPFVDLSEQLAAERAQTVLIPVREHFATVSEPVDATPTGGAEGSAPGTSAAATILLHPETPATGEAVDEAPLEPSWQGPFVPFPVDEDPEEPVPPADAAGRPARPLVDLNDDTPVIAGDPFDEGGASDGVEPGGDVEAAGGPAPSKSAGDDAVESPAGPGQTVAAGAIPAFLLGRSDTVALDRLNEEVRDSGGGASAEASASAASAPSRPEPVRRRPERETPAGRPAEAAPKQGERTLPPLSMLRHNPNSATSASSNQELEQTAEALQATLQEFNLHARVTGWISGPTVTTFKVQPGEGERVSRISNLEDDIALSLAAQSVRIFAPIPGTSLVGIEIPNRKRQNVNLADVLPYVQGGPLELAIGRDAEGTPVVADLAKMPHLLIAGTTGSGKSVMINSIVMTFLMRTLPEDVRLIMVDPKRVELAGYNGLPHLYVPVVTEPKQAASALQWAVSEMERRLKIFERLSVRKISTFNEKQEAGAFEHYDNPPQKMPYLVIIIDELSDLMMVAGKDVEASIVRIAQLGRAAGIHLIVATQRPSSNVVTGLIKANITNRIAFNVATGVDSRVIIDQVGAEKLTGLGDMLFSKVGWGKPKRIQGCFVSDDEIAQVVAFVKDQGEAEYHEEILSAVAPASLGGSAALVPEHSDDDPLLWNAAHIVVESQLGSTSGLQRRLKVGYARAGRIMDMLEEKGVVGPPDGSKPREVLLDEEGLAALEALEGPLTREEVEGY